MENKRTITTKMLEEIFKNVIKKLELDKITEIEVDEDLYRFIPTDEWARFDKDIILPGSLFDDFDSLVKAVGIPYNFTYVDFHRTASLLRFVSEKLNPVNG